MCLDIGIAEHTEALLKIADMAGKEYSIETILDKMEADWEGVNLELQPYKETGKAFNMLFTYSRLYIVALCDSLQVRLS